MKIVIDNIVRSAYDKSCPRFPKSLQNLAHFKSIALSNPKITPSTYCHHLRKSHTLLEFLNFFEILQNYTPETYMIILAP